MLRWFFTKKKPEDYEHVLSSLALDISRRQSRLADIRLRERRAMLLLTLYAFATWTAYVAVWYVGFVPRMLVRSSGGLEKFVRGLPVVVGPIAILSARRIVQLWYTRIGNAEEKTLTTLLAEQRAKVEEIKKITNYYTTKNLIDRYDEGAARSIESGPPRRAPGVLQSTPQKPSPLAPAATPQRGLADSLSPVAQLLPPAHRHWFDRVADALLGDDGAGAEHPQSRYALICKKCFAHNGLVRETEWANTKYICPKCGFFNHGSEAVPISPLAGPVAVPAGGTHLPLNSVPTEQDPDSVPDQGDAHMDVDPVRL